MKALQLELINALGLKNGARRSNWAVVLLMLISLTACGGGGGDSSGSTNPTPVSPSAPDNTPPTTTISASKNTAYANETILLVADSQDNIDGSITATLSCDQGVLDGNNLTLPSVTEATTVLCTATAQDAAGNNSSNQVSIELMPINMTESLLTPTAHAGGMYIVNLIGPEVVNDETFSVTLAGRSINALVIYDSQVALFLPTDLPTGTADIQLSYSAHRLSLSIDVLAAPVIDSPKDYLQTHYQTQISQIDSRQDSSVAAQETKVKLEAALAELAGMSEGELSETAIVTQQLYLNIDRLRAANSQENDARKFVSRASSFLCPHTPTLLGNVAVISIAVAAIGVGTLTAVEPVSSAALILTGATLLYFEVKDFKVSAGLMINECVVAATVDLDYGVASSSLYAPITLSKTLTRVNESDDDKAIATRQFATAMVKVGQTSALQNAPYTFLPNREREFTLVMTYGLESEEDHRNYVASVATIKKFATKYFPQSLIDVLATVADSDKRVEPIDPANIEVTQISAPNVYSSTLVSGDTLLLKFDFININEVTEGGVVSFTFTLTDSASGNQFHFDASLSLAKPTAYPLIFNTVINHGIYGVLSADNATSYTISQLANNGVVTLLNDKTGQFGYDAPKSGIDTFEYTATNPAGMSAPAIVTVNVLDTCDAEYSNSYLTDIPSYVECYYKGERAYYENLNIDSYQSGDNIWKNISIAIYQANNNLDDSAVPPVFMRSASNDGSYTIEKNDIAKGIGGRLVRHGNNTWNIVLFRYASNGKPGAYIDEYPRVAGRQYEETLSVYDMVLRVYAINDYHQMSSYIWNNYGDRVNTWFAQ